MLKITKANEPIEVKNTVLVLYGQPGVWKTSTGFTTESPILFDFDKGAYRSQFRKDSVPVETWKDVKSVEASDLKEYSTVVIDTVGRLLDALANHLIDTNPKYGQTDGSLSLKGYGALKAQYIAWLKRLKSFGKDIVLIAHDKEYKNGDDFIVRPDIQGGSYDEVFKSADAVGYMSRQGKNTILDFNPSDRWVGKNCANFDPIVVPDFNKEPLFLNDIINNIKNAMTKMSEYGLEIQAAVDGWKSNIDSAKSADEINNIMSEAVSIDVKPVKLQVAQLIKLKAESLGLVYDGEKGKGKYIEEAKKVA